MKSGGIIFKKIPLHRNDFLMPIDGVVIELKFAKLFT